jgi:biotin transport system substrate-specific component
VGGFTWIAVLGQVSVPLGFTPVPLSLGTLAVLTAGAALGWRRAVCSAALFLVAGLAGAPVFVGGHGGLGVPTLGYAVGYVFAAAGAGWASERGLDRSWWMALGMMTVGSAVIYLFGVPYLALALDLSWSGAIVQGMLPFVVGDLLKVLIAAAALPGAWAALGAVATRTAARAQVTAQADAAPVPPDLVP